MLGRTYDSQVCSISRMLEVFGERWTLLIMRNALFADSVRFTDFQQSLGIATNILATRLAHLVEQEVMTTDGAQYRLTARGRDLVVSLIALTEWGDRWAAPNGQPVRYTHDAGSHTVHARAVCEECGVLDDLDGVEALPGPGMPDHLAQRLTARHHQRHPAPPRLEEEQ
jgi:DNA-binding HxlR family transcriptional regulator